jgi:hypothetical protein
VNKNKLIPDEITSIHAKEIFERIVAGHSPYSVTKYFLKNKVLKPRCYDDIKEERKVLEELNNPYRWHESSVVKIIKNPVYLGYMVNHKTSLDPTRLRNELIYPLKTKSLLRILMNHWLMLLLLI